MVKEYNIFPEENRQSGFAYATFVSEESAILTVHSCNNLEWNGFKFECIMSIRNKTTPTAPPSNHFQQSQQQQQQQQSQHGYHHANAGRANNFPNMDNNSNGNGNGSNSFGSEFDDTFNFMNTHGNQGYANNSNKFFNGQQDFPPQQQQARTMHGSRLPHESNNALMNNQGRFGFESDQMQAGYAHQQSHGGASRFNHLQQQSPYHHHQQQQHQQQQQFRGGHNHDLPFNNHSNIQGNFSSHGMNGRGNQSFAPRGFPSQQSQPGFTSQRNAAYQPNNSSSLFMDEQQHRPDILLASRNNHDQFHGAFPPRGINPFDPQQPYPDARTIRGQPSGPFFATSNNTNKSNFNLNADEFIPSSTPTTTMGRSMSNKESLEDMYQRQNLFVMKNLSTGNTLTTSSSLSSLENPQSISTSPLARSPLDMFADSLLAKVDRTQPIDDSTSIFTTSTAGSLNSKAESITNNVNNRDLFQTSNISYGSYRDGMLSKLSNADDLNDVASNFSDVHSQSTMSPNYDYSPLENTRDLKLVNNSHMDAYAGRNQGLSSLSGLLASLQDDGSSTASDRTALLHDSTAIRFNHTTLSSTNSSSMLRNQFSDSIPSSVISTSPPSSVPPSSWDQSSSTSSW